MALSLKARKRWALVILLLGVPLYIIVAVSLVNWLYPDPMARPSFAVELGIYIGLGLIWALPFRFIFKGVGRDEG